MQHFQFLCEDVDNEFVVKEISSRMESNPAIAVAFDFHFPEICCEHLPCDLLGSMQPVMDRRLADDFSCMLTRMLWGGTDSSIIMSCIGWNSRPPQLL